MTRLDSNFFKKTVFSKSQISAYLKNAKKDLDIARKDPFVEVRFTYAYQALVKMGIAVLAHQGLKVRAIPGHHIKILESMSESLKEKDVFTLGNAMRMKRNEDLYGEGEYVSEKEAAEYLEFVQSTLAQVEKLIC